MNQINKAMKKEYYYLKEGEIIKDSDEVEVSNGWDNGEKWIKTSCTGQPAPNPHFISHRQYRRLISEK